MRKKYSREFKIQAVRLLEDGEKGGQQVDKELGIGAGEGHRWGRELEAEGERAFPGSGGHLLEQPEMKFRFMDEQRTYHSVEKLAVTLGVS